MELEEKIINFLENRAPIKAKEIAQELQETKTSINSKLYQMAEKGLCSKNQNNFWIVASTHVTNRPQQPQSVNSSPPVIGSCTKDIPIKKFENLNGLIAGYDPGGNSKNGFAILQMENGIIKNIEIMTLNNAESVITEITKNKNQIIGLGVDTLSCWCSGNSGWRPADIGLRKKYPDVRNSVMSPNALSGSMGINGMSVLIEIAKQLNGITLSETHPKVLYHALTKQKYDYDSNKHLMDQCLSDKLGKEVVTENDHEWDAVISAYALLMGIVGYWKEDLHKIKLQSKQGRMINPCGKTFYYWPEAL